MTIQKSLSKKPNTTKRKLLFPIITVASLTALAALQLYLFPPEEICSSKPVIQTANLENKNEIKLILPENIVLSCKKEMVPAFDLSFRLVYTTKIHDCRISNFSKNSMPHNALLRLQNEGIFTSRGKI